MHYTIYSLNYVVHQKYFKYNLRLFIKNMHSFVAIELLTFSKNAKKLFYCSRELSVFRTLTGLIIFAFCVYKNVSQKNWFLPMNENKNDFHHRKTTRMFLYTKKQK